MPLWSVQEWRARIGTSWCAMGRPIRSKTSRHRRGSYFTTPPPGGGKRTKSHNTDDAISVVVMVALLMGASLTLWRFMDEHCEIVASFFLCIPLDFLLRQCILCVSLLPSGIQTLLLTTLPQHRLKSDIGDSSNEDTSRALRENDFNQQRYRTCFITVLWNIFAKHLLSVLLLGYLFGTTEYDSIQPIVYIVKTALVALMVALELETAAVQVSLLLRCGDIEMNPGPLSREDLEKVDILHVLNEHDLKDVREELADIKSLCYQLGIELGLPLHELQSIQKDYQIIDQAFDQVLLVWLRQRYDVERHGTPSWGRLVEAVDSPSGGNNPVLAMAIASKHPSTVSEKTRLNFDIAMREGSVMMRNGCIFFLGHSGSGKTCTLYALLGKDPPQLRESTPFATKAAVRAVNQVKVGVSGAGHFSKINDDHYSEMLANSAEHYAMLPSSTDFTELVPSPPVALQVPKVALLATATEAEVKGDSIRDEMPVVGVGLKQELQYRMEATSKTSELELLHNRDIVLIKDSGGQPMFHEVLPAFITNTMFGIFIVKLNEPLDSRPVVEFYSSGSRIREPFLSPVTQLQTIQHCLRVIQSTCGADTRPKIIFIGTHRDLEHECPHEDREEKSRKLLSVIPPEMKDNIIYNGESPLFAINARAPGNDDRRMLGDLRQLMFGELQKLPRTKIPLRYFSLEIAIQRLAKYKRKAILSIDECLKEATAYHFTWESFDAALQYLHSLKLIMCYKDILPGVVFVDTQLLLDKITELVEHSIELRAKPNRDVVIPVAAAGSLEFKTCGIVTAEFLSQFSSGYEPGLFEEEHLITLFKKLLIVAEIGKGKFLMPCLLNEEETKISSDLESGIPALLFYFGPNGPRLGIYCFLLASLITDANWKLLTEDGNPVQLSRNRVRFAVPGNNPGCVTITDSFSTYLHVSIEFPVEVSSAQVHEICVDVCPAIRETVLTSIRKASHRLNYVDSTPEVAFLCSMHDSSTPPHPSIISQSAQLLTCTTHPRSVFSELNNKHRIWLGKDMALTGSTFLSSTVGLTLKTELKEQAITEQEFDTLPTQYTTAATSRLHGVEVCGETTLIVYSAHNQQITWPGYGLRIQIWEGSLPEGMEECTINIVASVAGQYEFPENSHLVSPVFWFRCDTVHKFTKPITVEIQHCACTSNLSFVRAVCSQKQLPYTFKRLAGGDFPGYNSYGVIELDKFSGVAEIQEGSDERNYLANLLYKEITCHPSRCIIEIFMVITWNVDAHRTVMIDRFKEAQWETDQPIEFQDDHVKFIITNRETKWKINCLNSPVVMKKDVDRFDPGGNTSWVPCSKFKAKYSDLNLDNICDLECDVKMDGAKEPYNKFVIDITPQGPLASGESGHGRQSKRLNDGHLSSLLQQLSSHAAKWHDIGVNLGFTAGELENIQGRSTLLANSPRSWLHEMLSRWLQWAPKDARGSAAFATLGALKDALNRADLGAAAHDLHL